MLTTFHLAEEGQLLSFDLGSAIWVLVIFLFVAIILYRTAWKNVLAGLKAREERIRGDIANAEANRRKAEEMLKKYNDELAMAQQKVRGMLDQATIDAEKLSTSIRMRSQQETEEAKERATKEIESAKQQALREIYEQAASLATSIAEKIIRRNLNADDQRDLVSQSLEQLKSVTNN